MVIGITGGSGCGKSYVAKVFEELGFEIIDADAISKEIMQCDLELISKIADFFGIEYLNSDGSVNRRKLGAYVFKNEDKLKALSDLTHPQINKVITERVSCAKKMGKNAVIDVPLLIGSPLTKLCDFTVAVVADENIRISRIMQRDKIEPEAAKNRISMQLTNDEYVKNTNYTIFNNGESIKKQVLEILNKYDCFG